MKSRALGYLLVIAVLGLTTVASTRAMDPPSPGEVPPENQKDMQQEVSGTIATIDVSARIIRISGTFPTKTFKVSPDVQIVISQMPEARLNDLKTGDQVDVSYHEQDGALVATHITRAEAKPPPVEK
jgi:hypothetical protein